MQYRVYNKNTASSLTIFHCFFFVNHGYCCESSKFWKRHCLTKIALESKRLTFWGTLYNSINTCNHWMCHHSVILGLILHYFSKREQVTKVTFLVLVKEQTVSVPFHWRQWNIMMSYLTYRHKDECLCIQIQHLLRRQLLLMRWYLRQQRVIVRVMIRFWVQGRVG